MKFPDTHRSHLRNPLIDLPIKAEMILEGVDVVIITHTNLDHWDDVAQKSIPKNASVCAESTRSKNHSVSRHSRCTHFRSNQV